MRNFNELLKIASSADIPVLILGESGSGKEVAARKVHTESKRNKGPFIALNCGAIPSTLMESILEGSEKGAFTGAVSNRKGVVRAAEGGTLFLDEVGELPLQSQARLLRILQEKSVLPIGAHVEISVNFRLICATNRNLPNLVKQGTFREDLYFRLNVFPIQIPPLRERTDEFLNIVHALWTHIENENMFSAWKRELSAGEIHALKSFHWPGNIRQLKNILERYHLLGHTLNQQGESIMTLLSEERIQYDAMRQNDSFKAVRPYKNAPCINTILDVLKNCRQNKSMAARKLGISRGSLCYQLKKSMEYQNRL